MCVFCGMTRTPCSWALPRGLTREETFLSVIDRHWEHRRRPRVVCSTSHTYVQGRLQHQHKRWQHTRSHPKLEGMFRTSQRAARRHRTHRLQSLYPVLSNAHFVRKLPNCVLDQTHCAARNFLPSSRLTLRSKASALLRCHDQRRDLRSYTFQIFLRLLLEPHAHPATSHSHRFPQPRHHRRRGNRIGKNGRFPHSSVNVDHVFAQNRTVGSHICLCALPPV